MGGLFVRVFADRYPNEVAGLVLVDPSHPDQLSPFLRTFGPGVAISQLAMLAALAVMPVGIVRHLVDRGALGPVRNMIAGANIDEDADLRIALTLRPAFRRMLLSETVAFLPTARQARAAAPLGDRPLVVITATRDAPIPVSAEHADRARQLWRALHEDLLSLSSNCTHVLAPDSGHFICQDRPDLVFDAIKSTVTAARDRREAGQGRTENHPLPQSP
jgi:pimeloyl-ACP methyl ester carboxylesterase